MDRHPVPPGGFSNEAPSIASDSVGHTLVAVADHFDGLVHLRAFGTRTWTWWTHLDAIPSGEGPGPVAITADYANGTDRIGFFAAGWDGNIYQATRMIS